MRRALRLRAGAERLVAARGISLVPWGRIRKRVRPFFAPAKILRLLSGNNADATGLTRKTEPVMHSTVWYGHNLNQGADHEDNPHQRE